MSSEFTVKRTSCNRFENNSLSVRTSSFLNKFNKSFCFESFRVNNNFLCAKIVNKKVRFNIPYPSCRKSNRKLLLGRDTLKRNRFLETWIGKQNIERYKYQHRENIP